jgi:hypothetical protein
MGLTAERRACERALSIALSAAMIGSCVPANPTEADGSRVVRHQVAQEGKGLARLASFKKTGGQRSAFLGVTTYTMEYSAQIEFLKDACYGGGLSARDYLPPHYDRSGLPASEEIAAACFRIHVLKGERREVTGTLPFEKTQHGGWRGADGRLY